MVTGVLSALLITAGLGAFGFVVGGPVGLLIAGGVGLLFGVIYGAGVRAAGAYQLSARGIVAFLVDHTWSLPNTVAGALFLALCRLAGNPIDSAFSQRYQHIGLQKAVIPGYAATTIGPVQAGTGGVDRHEAIHVLQARLFGPAYLPLVILNYVIATVLPYWLLANHKPITGIGTYFTHGVYPYVWNEAWAYRVEGSPP